MKRKAIVVVTMMIAFQSLADEKIPAVPGAQLNLQPCRALYRPVVDWPFISLRVGIPPDYVPYKGAYMHKDCVPSGENRNRFDDEIKR